MVLFFCSDENLSRYSQFVYSLPEIDLNMNKNLKTAKMDRKGSGFGLSKKITPLLLLQLLILPTLSMFFNDFVLIW